MQNSLDALFQNAVVLIDEGNVPKLDALLRHYPELVHERLQEPGAWLRDVIGNALDGFYKDPYLLWFVTEDAVRTGRMPENVAEVAKTIIHAAKRENVQSLEKQLKSTLHFAICTRVGRENGLPLKLIDALIDEGANPNSTLDGWICNNQPAVELLLKRGAKLTLSDAVCLHRFEEAEKLVQKADPDEKQIAFAAAARNGNAEAVRFMLEAGVDINAYNPLFYTHATPLHHAVWTGSLETVKAIVEAGAKLDTPDTLFNGTPLGWAKHGASEKNELEPHYLLIAEYLQSIISE